MGAKGGYVEVEGAARALTDSFDRYIILLVVLSERLTLKTHTHKHTHTEAGASRLMEGGLGQPVHCAAADS